jgi:hypothetical protein
MYLGSVHEAGNLCSRLFQCVVDEYESLHWWNFIKQDRLLDAMSVLNGAELYLLRRLVEEADETLH